MMEHEKYETWIDFYGQHLHNMFEIMKSSSINCDSSYLNKDVDFGDFCICVYDSTFIHRSHYRQLRGANSPP